MPELDFVRELVAVPIGITALYVVYKLSKNFSEKFYVLATNHMNSLAEALDRLADAVENLREELRR